ncbi:MAG: LysR family transcriptional regulator [Gemmatimonadota bacterium]|nr:LysR family transcriptional regulator [Gemmatimonadota bacterium]
MIENIETLAALSEAGTMTKAGTRLRISQSAVSKRIDTLESVLGRKLIEPVGRRVRLTAAGIQLLEKTAPFMAALKEAVADESPVQASRLVIGISESILASWGSRVLAGVVRAIPQLELDINAHRSPVVIDHVRSGEYMLAICADLREYSADMTSEPLVDEPMVLVPSGLKPFRLRRDTTLSVITIEPHATTWRRLEHRIRALSGGWNIQIDAAQTLQSFAGIVQMARSGFGHGLVPVGIARALGIPEPALVRFPEPGLSRPIALVGRSTTFARPIVRSFHRILRKTIPPNLS